MSSENVSYSHPQAPVRHSYPVVASSDGFGPAIDVCLKTMPFVLLRLGILVGFTLVAVIWFAICAGVGMLFSGLGSGGEGGGVFLFLVGIGAPAGVLWYLQHYILYLLKLGHIAVITKLITDGRLPEGVNQVEYGKQIVTSQFAQTNILFVLDSLITGVARAFNRTLDWLAGFLPIPGLENLMKVVNAIVTAATQYIDETIFSYNLARGDANPWRSSSDGLVYYAQNVKPILKTAIWSVVLEYSLTFLAFVLCLIPAYLFALILPSSVAGWSWLFAVFLAVAIRTSVLHPIFLTMVALTFHKSVYGQSIDESYAATLSSASGKFQELAEKGREWVAGERAGETATPTTIPA